MSGPGGSSGGVEGKTTPLKKKREVWCLFIIIIIIKVWGKGGLARPPPHSHPQPSRSVRACAEAPLGGSVPC